MSTLVAYASKHGATVQIAERVAQKLRAAGLDAEARPVERAGDLDGYDAFVIGSALYFGSWLKEATALVRRNRALLASRPVWLFSSGPLGTAATDARGGDLRAAAEPSEIAELREAIGPRDHRVFFGALDRRTFGVVERVIAALPAGRELLVEGDFRDWTEIETWAEGIARWRRRRPADPEAPAMRTPSRSGAVAPRRVSAGSRAGGGRPTPVTTPVSPTMAPGRPRDAPPVDRRTDGRRSRSATRLTVSTIGALMALGGIEHGVGEILQGDVAPTGTVIVSWPGQEAFRIVAGEPAMTIVPHLRATGILAVLVSLLFLAWATVFVHRKHAGTALIVLAVAMLLVGGGFGPPLVGVVLGVAATGIDAPAARWRTQGPSGPRRLLAGLWPWSFGADLIAWLSLFPGLVLVGYFVGGSPVPDALLYALIVAAFGLLLLTIVAGFARDARPRAGAVPAPSAGGSPGERSARGRADPPAGARPHQRALGPAARRRRRVSGAPLRDPGSRGARRRAGHVRWR